MATTKKTGRKMVGRPAKAKAVNTDAVTDQTPQVAQENASPRTEGERAKVRTPRTRIPFGAPRSKLVVPIKPEGYHLHWVNDDAGRIFAAQQGFYEFCSPSECGLDETEDGKVKVLVGKNAQNGPLFAYLMKIKLEYYEEDRDLINSQQDSFEEAIKRGLNSNGEHGYIPKEGIKFS